MSHRTFYNTQQPRVVTFIETENRTVGAGDTEGGQCFLGTESQFGKMRKFRRWVVRMVDNNVNALRPPKRAPENG